MSCMMAGGAGGTQRESGVSVVTKSARPPSSPVMIINLALKDGTFYLGEIPTQLQGEVVQAIDRDSFLKIASPILKSEIVEEVRGLPGNGEFTSIKVLKDAGLAFEFDMDQMTLTFLPTVEQRPRGHIMLGHGDAPSSQEQLSPSASLSGFVNLNAGMQYNSAGPAGRGFSSQSLGVSSAIRFMDLVIENEATITPGSVTHQGTRAIYDDPVNALRYTVGDITPGAAGLQGGQSLLGFSVQKSYGKLQPQKNIRPTGQRSFRLERPSEVDIVVNGQVVRRLQMPPGDHDISDLPLKAGENVLTLEITDDAGKHTTLNFTVFFDHALLTPGISEWGFAGGIKSTAAMSGLGYSWNSPALTGYYQLGLTEDLTATAHMQADEQAFMAGIMAITQSWWGSVSVEGAISVRRDGAVGEAASVTYSPQTLFNTWCLPGNLQLAANYRSNDFTTILSQITDNGDDLSLNGSYSLPLPEDYALALSGSISLGNSSAAGRTGAAISLTKSIKPDMSWGLTASYDNSPNPTAILPPSAWDVVGRLNMKLGADTELSYTQDATNGKPVVGINSAGQISDGRFSVNASLEEDPQSVTGGVAQAQGDVAASYSGTRFDVSASNSHRMYTAQGGVISNVSIVSGSTAIAFADGHVAAGRPVSDSFAIVAPHQSLSDATLRVAQNDSGSRAATDWFGPALVSDLSSYSHTQLPLTVENAPDGYDVGSGVFDVNPSYKSGYVLTVGSDYHILAIGTINAANGEPLALLSGLAKEEGVPSPHRTAFFTNRMGRFSADGLRAGHWRIELIGDPPACFRLDVPTGVTGVYDAGMLSTPCAR